GPATVCIHWDMENDIFTPGQWVRGYVRPYMGSISPDGQLLFTMITRYGQDPETWVTVSRPPYQTALVFGEVPCAYYAFTSGFDADGTITIHPDNCALDLRYGTAEEMNRFVRE